MDSLNADFVSVSTVPYARLESTGALAVTMAEPSVSLRVSDPRPCLRGHHQCHHGPSSTRTASGDVRVRPQRSRHAAIAGHTTPLACPAGDATAATSPSLLQGALASAAITSVVAVRPRPERTARTLGAGNSALYVRRFPHSSELCKFLST